MVILAIGFIVLLSHEMGWIGPQRAHAFTFDYDSIEAECIAHTNIQGAYAAVIHRVWIDQPSYVEDVLWETDEMLHLDALLEGNWEDTFYFWSEKDSIDYATNWKRDPLCIQIEPDTIPQQVNPDKRLSKVNLIVIPHRNQSNKKSNHINIFTRSSISHVYRCQKTIRRISTW